MIDILTVKAIFANVTIPYELGCSYDEGEDCGYTIDEFAAQFNDGSIQFANGVSKCALVIDDEDEVLKIPFKGRYYEDEDVDDETGEVLSEGYFEEFEYADDIEGISDWNYCENELVKYNRAVKAGFGEFFAATRFVDTIQDIPIYAQEKCEAVSWGGKSKTDIPDKSKTVYDSNIEYDYDRLSEYWVCAAIDWYGAEKVLDFIHYLSDNHIYDLHNGNVGFSTIDSRPVLIDWAGWRE